ncbi:MAG TPA: aquaporin [Polyangiaceae bacterium]|nr:aquaporin [Polyangiaceae bacterium]
MVSVAVGLPRSEFREKLRIYAIDGALLGLFMLSACVSVVMLEHPASPARLAITSALSRRVIVAVAMGLTAAGLIYSPWGKRSGAFMNPAMVVCFVRLGKLSIGDACGYIGAQFAGSVGGVFVAAVALPGLVSQPAVNYVATTPSGGPGPAFLVESCMAFVLISVVTAVNRSPRLAPFAGVFAAMLVALFISVAAPISGMSINPARTFGSALWAHSWSGFWIYLSAPLFGMLASTELQLRLVKRDSSRLCGKVNHDETIDCFVRCGCTKGTSHD